MQTRSGDFTFCWWNLHNFSHYNADFVSKRRWCKSQAEYEAKKKRFHDILGQLFPVTPPDLLAVCEITREAATDLTDTLPGPMKLTVAPAYPRDDGFQVAVFYNAARGLTAEPPLVPNDFVRVTAETRPMIPVHLSIPGHVIRFVACHWPAFEGDESDLSRERVADALREDTYAFLHPEEPEIGVTRHVVVVGDFNAEPTATLFRKQLPARRDRDSIRDSHWRDEDVMRVRLYNLAWRFLGEQVAHGEPERPGGAGTVFEDPHTWKTFDHVLVSAGPLTQAAPFIDESRTGVMCTPLMLADDGRPRPFVPGSPLGMSDHLPIVGRLVLPEYVT